MTDPNNRWPTFIIIGAPKAGTTSAYFYLRQHPDVFMSPVKEPHYFAVKDQQEPRESRMHGVTFTLEEYQALFDGASGETARGEASTGYLMSPQAAERMAEVIPDVKIIVILRNPAERAFSGYMMKTRNSREFGDLSVAFQRGKAFVENGFYYDNLLRYFDKFPRENIGVFIFEEFSKNPVETMQRMYRFIGVDDTFSPSTQQHNQAWFPKYPQLNALRTQLLKSRKLRKAIKGSFIQKSFRKLTRGEPPTFPPELRRELLNLYREDINKSQELLSIDLSSWLDEDATISAPHQ